MRNDNLTATDPWSGIPPDLRAYDRGDRAERFRRALATGNPRQVRSAAAELPGLSLAEAGAMLLVIERTEPENYERTALQWLARFATESRGGGLLGVAHAAMALEALPHEPGARATLADACRRAGLPAAAAVFAPGPG